VYSGGYFWDVVPVEHSGEYIQILEFASVDKNIVPFTKFIALLL